MSKFENDKYRFQLDAILNDAYLSNMSYDGKITRLRTYAEIIIRKMLDMPNKVKMSIGWTTIDNIIKDMPYYDKRKIIFDTINDLGTSRTHTERETEESEDEFEVVAKENFE